MHTLLFWVARLAGATGTLLAVFAGLSRLAGHYQVGGFQMLTLLEAGTAAVAIGCFSYLAAIAEKAA